MGDLNGGRYFRISISKSMQKKVFSEDEVKVLIARDELNTRK